MKCEYFTPLAYILHVCTIYNPILVKCVRVTTLHLGVPLMGRQQIEAPWTFHMAFAYVCDISSLLCNKVCVQVNLLCATYCLLPSMVFHSTIKLSIYIYIYMFLHEYLPFFYVILKNIIKTGITLLRMTILLIIVVVICQQNYENHSKTVIYNYFLGQTLGFGIITSDM